MERAVLLHVDAGQATAAGECPGGYRRHRGHSISGRVDEHVFSPRFAAADVLSAVL